MTLQIISIETSDHFKIPNGNAQTIYIMSNVNMINTYDIDILQFYLPHNLINIIHEYVDEYIEFECKTTIYYDKKHHIYEPSFIADQLYIDNKWIDYHLYFDNTEIDINSTINIDKFVISNNKIGHNLHIDTLNNVQLINEYMKYACGLENYLISNIDNMYTFIDNICIFKNNDQITILILQNTYEIILLAHITKKFFDYLIDKND